MRVTAEIDIDPPRGQNPDFIVADICSAFRMICADLQGGALQAQGCYFQPLRASDLERTGWVRFKIESDKGGPRHAIY